MLDQSLHPPAPADKTLMLVNQLITSTAEQLNRFGGVCEEKLLTLHHKASCWRGPPPPRDSRALTHPPRPRPQMQRLETEVRLLECKLSSIPGLEEQPKAIEGPPSAPSASASETPQPTGDSSGAPAAEPSSAAAPPAAPEAAAPAEVAPEVAAEPEQKIKDDPRFVKYFKMLNFGVPLPVVEGAFRAETGHDPALLQTPNAAAPPGGEGSGGPPSEGEGEGDE